MRKLCQQFDISPKTGYKWINRFLEGGPAALEDRSRRPHRSPRCTPRAVEKVVLSLRDRHPAWGGRKLRHRLLAQGRAPIPSASAITKILRRHGRIAPEESGKHKAFQRFEYEAPNKLWQMDFKGHFAMLRGRCHPFTVLDDHSRFAVTLKACADERTMTVKGHLSTIFERYGLPERILMDNGSPWGADRDHPFTPLGCWLIRLGIQTIHGRPYHPQTQGKEERFHRTIQAEVLSRRTLRDLSECQTVFDKWRDVYNLERPHEALGMMVPGKRYYPSPRAFPAVLAPIEYGPGDIVRKVQSGGQISYRGRTFTLSKAFHGYPVALRATQISGLMDIFFCHQKVGQINLRESSGND